MVDKGVKDNKKRREMKRTGGKCGFKSQFYLIRTGRDRMISQNDNGFPSAEEASETVKAT